MAGGRGFALHGTQVLSGTSQQGGSGLNDPAVQAMYHRACSWSWLREARSLLRGCSRSLLDLDAIRTGGHVRSSFYAGVHTVPIRRICGTEGRRGDFDADFRPLQPHNEQRWLSIAAARQKGVSLPPVDLVMVGDVYFVRDGHHRISVARAWGQESIEARVTVWELKERDDHADAHAVSVSV